MTINLDILYVVATLIHPDGETDALFIEPATEIDDGCVALTQPTSWDEAERLLYEMRAERELEQKR